MNQNYPNEEALHTNIKIVDEIVKVKKSRTISQISTEKDTLIQNVFHHEYEKMKRLSRMSLQTFKKGMLTPGIPKNCTTIAWIWSVSLEKITKRFSYGKRSW